MIQSIDKRKKTKKERERGYGNFYSRTQCLGKSRFGIDKPSLLFTMMREAQWNLDYSENILSINATSCGPMQRERIYSE